MQRNGKTELPVSTLAHEPILLRQRHDSVGMCMCMATRFFYLVWHFGKYSASDRELDEKFNTTIMSVL